MKKTITIVLICVMCLAFTVINTVFATSNETLNNTNSVEDQIQESNSVSMDTDTALPDVPASMDPGMELPDEIQAGDDDEYGIMPISEENWMPGDYARGEENSEYINSDLFLAEDNITVTSSVDGNIYAFGDKVKISSSMVSGNVMVIAEEVTIDADVSGGLYIIADHVTITASAQDAYIAADTVNFDSNSYITRDAKVFAKNVNLKGYIYRDFYSYSKATNIEGPLANVAGKLYYTNNLNSDNSELVQNAEKMATLDINTSNELVEATNKLNIVASAFSGVVIIIVFLFITKNRVKGEKGENPIISVLIGLVGVILTPIIIVLLMITLIGIPLSILFLALYIIMLCISIPVTSLKLSDIIIDANTKTPTMLIRFLGAIVAFAILKLIAYVPVIGPIIRVIAIMYGFRTILGLVFQNSKSKNIEKEIEAVKTEEN